MANLQQMFRQVGTDYKALYQKVQQIASSNGTKIDESTAQRVANAAIVASIGNVESLLSSTSTANIAALLTYMNNEVSKLRTGQSGAITEQVVQNKIDRAIANLVDNAPENLNTLNEIVTKLTSGDQAAQQLLTSLGSLERLQTTAKGSAVDALNELFNKVSTLTTQLNDYKSSNDAAVSALSSKLSTLEKWKTQMDTEFNPATDYLKLYTDARGDITL